MEKALGLRLRGIRKGHGLTQEAMAEALGCAPEYISRIETGRVQPSWRFLTRFANVLRVPVTDLLQEAGFLERTGTPGDREDIVAFVQASPEAAWIFEYLRKHPEDLPEIARFVRYVAQERTSGGGDGRDPGGHESEAGA